MMKKNTLKNLIKKFQRKTIIFRNHAEYLRKTPPPFLINNNQADACDELSGVCEQLASFAQEEQERRRSLRSEKQ